VGSMKKSFKKWEVNSLSPFIEELKVSYQRVRGGGYSRGRRGRSMLRACRSCQEGPWGIVWGRPSIRV